jgi:hypothetical protein
MANNQMVNFNTQDVANTYRRNQYAQALQERMNAPAPVHTFQGFQAPTSPAAGIAKALDIYSVWQNEKNQEKQYQNEKAAAEKKVLDENLRLEGRRQDFVNELTKPNLTENQMPDARSSSESGIPLDQPRADVGTGEYTSTPKTNQQKLAFALSRIGDPTVSTTAKGYVDQINEETKAEALANKLAPANPGTDFSIFDTKTGTWKRNEPVVTAKIDIAKAGRNNNNTSYTNKVEPAALVTGNDSFIKDVYRPVQDQYKAGLLTNGRLDALEALKIDELTGWGTEAKAYAANVLTSLGIGGEEAKEYASDAQSFRAIQFRQVSDELLLAKGVQAKDDAIRAEKTYSTLVNTPEGNDFINKLQRAVVQKKGEEAKYYRDNYTKALKTGDLSSLERDWLNTPEAEKSVFSSSLMKKWNTPKPSSPQSNELPSGVGTPASSGTKTRIYNPKTDRFE